jgi:hypothetical protein
LELVSDLLINVSLPEMIGFTSTTWPARSVEQVRRRAKVSESAVNFVPCRRILDVIPGNVGYSFRVVQ